MAARRETVIVIDGSTDLTAGALRPYAARAMPFHRSRGRAAARNAGPAAVGSGIVISLLRHLERVAVGYIRNYSNHIMKITELDTQSIFAPHQGDRQAQRRGRHPTQRRNSNPPGRRPASEATRPASQQLPHGRVAHPTLRDLRSARQLVIATTK